MCVLRDAAVGPPRVSTCQFNTFDRRLLLRERVLRAAGSAAYSQVTFGVPHETMSSIPSASTLHQADTQRHKCTQ